MSEEMVWFYDRFLKEKPIEEQIKENAITQCRYMDKADIYEWVASNELKIYKQGKEIERLNNIINELERYCNEEIEDYDKHIKSQYITDIAKEQYEGEKVCFEDMLYKIKELKGSDKE